MSKRRQNGDKKKHGKTRNCREVDKTLQGTTKIYGITCERRQNGDKKVYEKLKKIRDTGEQDTE